MKTKTIHMTIGGAVLSFAALAVFATAATGQDRPVTPSAPASEAQQMPAARQAELVEIGRLLSDPAGPAAKERFGAINILVHIASSYSVLPDEVKTLLVRATADRDPEIVRLAEHALFNLETRGEDPEAGVPEDILIERSRRADLERAQAILTESSDRGDRFGAVQMLVHLASLGAAAPVISAEAAEELGRLETDSDFEVAQLAARALANREGRAMDPAFSRSPARRAARSKPEGPGVEEPDPFAGLTSESPGVRLGALELILDAALSDNRRADPKVVDAFVRLLDDPDPRVAYRAANALAGLAGDENALANVYVGKVVDDPAGGKPQVEAAADLVSPPNLGSVDDHGVFVGTVLVAGQLAAAGGESQPASPAVVAVGDGGAEHVGTLDEHGVFIGVVEDAGTAGEEQQP